jgi:MFS family permease
LYVFAQIFGGIFSNFLWAKVSKKLGNKSVLKFCILTGATIPVLAVVCSFYGAIWFIGIFLLIGIITSGRNLGFEPYLLDIAPNDKRTIYLGIRGTLNIFVVILPILGGIFIEKLGFQVSFIIVTCIMLFAFLILQFDKRIKNREE